MSICCFSGIREFIHNFLIVDLCILCIAGFLIRSGEEIQGISLAVIQFIAFLQIRDRCGIVTTLISCISGSVKRLYCTGSHLFEYGIIENSCISGQAFLIYCVVISAWRLSSAAVLDST